MKKTLTYTVWSLDVLGHGSAECCKSYDCSCLNEDGTHDESKECDAGYEVNDRSRWGTIEVEVEGETFNAGTPQEFVSYAPTDEELVTALINVGFLTEEAKETVESDGTGDETDYHLEDSETGRPLCQLELKAD
jgi:hypothetical protein